MKYFYQLLFLFFTIIGFYFFYTSIQTNYRYIYPLDDVYIHLAVAKNFSEYGNWSINTHGFESASSSIYYTLILGFFIKLIGDYQYLPLLLNIIFGSSCIYIYSKFFNDFYGKKEKILAYILLFPFSLLHVMVLQGMEHTLHMFIMVCIFYFIKKIEYEETEKHWITIIFLLIINSLIRYESMFFTLSFSFILLVRKKIKKSIIVLLSGLLPILIFGFISVKNGGFFFPNSIIVKGNFPRDENLISLILGYFKHAFITYIGFWKWLAFPFLLIAIDLLSKYKKENINDFLKENTSSIVIIMVGFLHSFFAILEFRYENYIMISLLLILVPIITNFYSLFFMQKIKLNFQNTTMGISCMMILLISIYRMGYQNNVLLESSKNIFNQQIQMSDFLKKFYQNQTIGANDIGAIAYFSNVNLLDFVGLGTNIVAKFEKENSSLSIDKYQANKKLFLKEFSEKKKCKIIIIYQNWFQNSIPSQWIHVADWITTKGFGPAQNRVSFYATDKTEALKLKKNLEKFYLPKDVKISFSR